MADGIFISGERPRSKRQVREAVASDPNSVAVEVTAFGRERTIPLSSLPQGETVYFVGPDPYTSRKFYGQLVFVNRPRGGPSGWVVK